MLWVPEFNYRVGGGVSTQPPKALTFYPAQRWGPIPIAISHGRFPLMSIAQLRRAPRPSHWPFLGLIFLGTASVTPLNESERHFPRFAPPSQVYVIVAHDPCRIIRRRRSHSPVLSILGLRGRRGANEWLIGKLRLYLIGFWNRAFCSKSGKKFAEMLWAKNIRNGVYHLRIKHSSALGDANASLTCALLRGARENQGGLPPSSACASLRSP